MAIVAAALEKRDHPGLIFNVDGEDTGGPLFVMTMVGFGIGPDLDFARVVDSRINLD